MPVVRAPGIVQRSGLTALRFPSVVSILLARPVGPKVLPALKGPPDSIPPAATSLRGPPPLSDSSTHTVRIQKLAVPNVKATIAYSRMRPTLSLAAFGNLE